MSGIEVVTYGPFFDGRADIAVADACEAIEKEVAQVGVDEIDERLNKVLRTQTPLYRLRINARPEHPSWLINDLDCVYGPWLEGTSSRNNTTRFKGYKTFRLIAQKLNRRAGVIGRPVMKRFMERMN